MKLNIRKKSHPEIVTEPRKNVALLMMLSFIHPNISAIEKMTMNLVSKSGNYRKPHQGKKECARRVKNGQDGTCYKKRQSTGVILEGVDANYFPLSFANCLKKNSRSLKRRIRT